MKDMCFGFVGPHTQAAQHNGLQGDGVESEEPPRAPDRPEEVGPGFLLAPCLQQALQGPASLLLFSVAAAQVDSHFLWPKEHEQRETSHLAL